MVSSITAHLKEATEMRAEGKSENELAIKDSQAAQAAIANAVAVLTDFYKESGAVAKESWELLQEKKKGVDLPEKPETWDSGYTGVADPKGQPDGIITVLEATAADFAAMEADTHAQ